MSRINRIRDHVDLGLSEDFLTADNPSREMAEIGDSDIQVVRSDIDLDAVGALIEEIMQRHERYSTVMDKDMTVELHKRLPLLRSEAADSRLWAWFGICKYPGFVAWRWSPRSSNGYRSAARFCGSAVRQAFARLWWAAELTVDDEDNYELTNKLLDLKGFQDTYEAIFGRAFCQYRPAIKAFIETVGHMTEKTIRETAKEFGYILTTLLLESMKEEDIKNSLEKIVSSIEL